MITVPVKVCLLLPESVCDAALLYLASDNNSPLPLFDDGSAVGWVMEWEEEPGGEQNRKNPDPRMWRAGIEGAGSHASDARLITLNTPLHPASGTHRKGSEIWARLEFDRGRLPFEIVLLLFSPVRKLLPMYPASRLALLPMRRASVAGSGANDP